jgi:hypothetical protein
VFSAVVPPSIVRSCKVYRIQFDFTDPKPSSHWKNIYDFNRKDYGFGLATIEDIPDVILHK